MLSVLLDGFVVGLLLQVAIGPVFLFILNVAMQRTVVDGWFAAVAATLVDYLYITLAVLGVGQLLARQRIKYVLGIVSSLVLLVFGAMMVVSAAKAAATKAAGADASALAGAPNYGSSFVSAFLLTLSSPLTIVFWTSLFATKAIEKGYSKRELGPFGFAAGLATLTFLGLSVTVLSMVKASIPLVVIQALNLVVGLLLTLYGVIRLFKTYSGKKRADQPAAPAA
jgi:threonine/homoserine/homoserine lactone efflux protein